MRKSIHQLLALVLGLALVGPVAAAELKVAVVNAARVMAESPQAEQARKQLEKEFAPRDKELAAMQKDVQEMEERFKRDASVMSESEQRNLERDIVSRKRDLRRLHEEFREDFNLRRNELLGKLQQRVVETIEALAKEEKYDLILSDGVVFASKKIDITDRVIQRMSR